MLQLKGADGEYSTVDEKAHDALKQHIAKRLYKDLQVK
eukprot:gene7625-10403_t